MKLPSLSKKSNSKSSFTLRATLLMAFLAVLAFEGWLVYSQLYSNVFSSPGEVTPGNVVRVNFKAYESTVEYLKSLYEFEPGDIVLPRENPFR